MLDALGSVGLVVHEEEVNIASVLNEERLVAGGHHVASLLVRAIADLYHRNSCQHSPDSKPRIQDPEQHTEGMAIWPLNLRRTRLSIPFGFRQLEGMHL